MLKRRTDQKYTAVVDSGSWASGDDSKPASLPSISLHNKKKNVLLQSLLLAVLLPALTFVLLFSVVRLFVKPPTPTSSQQRSSDGDFSDAPPIDLGRAPGTHVIVSIGSSFDELDPIVPRPTDDPCTIALAFAPIVGSSSSSSSSSIPYHPALRTVTAAIAADDAGWTTVRDRRGGRDDPRAPVVASTVRLRRALASLRSAGLVVDVLWINDVVDDDDSSRTSAAVSDAGPELVRAGGAKRLVVDATTTRRLCDEWWPRLTGIGYAFEGATTTEGDGDGERSVEGLRDADEAAAFCASRGADLRVRARWRSGAAPPSGPNSYRYGTRGRASSERAFDEKVYTACDPRTNGDA